MKKTEMVKVSTRKRNLPVLFFIGIFFFSFSITVNSSTENAWEKAAETNELFPRPAAIEPAVHFWTRIYSEISSSEGFIHDNVNLSIIYEKIKVPKDSGWKARSRYTKKFKKKYQKILNSLARGKRKGLTKEEKRVLALWPENVTNKELARAKNNLRFQLGQSDKFKAGLIRSGSWKPYILATLDKMGLPRELAALPHVESSFNYKAYSKAGAAGMWQFTRSTGRRYMRVDHVLDERLDPFIASVAAAQLLKNNYAMTGTWPLAVTAYNHGASGLRRAARKVGTKDIARIISQYQSDSFGFASRNFYTSFLAAVDIDRAPEKYFKNIQLNAPAKYEFIKLPAYLSAETVLKALNISKADFMESNPALRQAIWNGDKYIPENYEIRIDPALLSHADMAATKLSDIDPTLQFQEQQADRFHRVRKGQNLSIIAVRYKVRVKDLVVVNNMPDKHRIRAGQILILPQSKVSKKRAESIDLPEDGIYIVKRGDSIDRIAKKNSITVKKLLKLNNIRDKNKIYPGQKLVLIEKDEIT